MTTFVLAEVKAINTKEPTGEFEAVLSAPTLDRDGEVIDKGAFNPLPESIPIHAYHDFSDPIGRGTPYYDGDLLKVRGVFASTARAQEIRTLVAEGVIANMSVGFMAAERETVEKVPHVLKAEILEGSFVSIPSNREAAVLVAKQYAKAGARNNKTDAERLQEIHDLAVSNGATCEAKAEDDEPAEDAPVSEEHEFVDENGDGMCDVCGKPEDDHESPMPAEEMSADPAEKAAAPAAAVLPADVALKDQAFAEIARASAALLKT